MRKNLERVAIATVIVGGLFVGRSVKEPAFAGVGYACMVSEAKCYYDCDTGLPLDPSSVPCFLSNHKWKFVDES